MWEDANYCWVVLCKKHWFHMRQNFFFRHRIPLAETDAVTPLPSLGKRLLVRCDDCKPKDVRRVELELPESFKPHPLFREELAFDDVNRTTEQQSPQQEPPQEIRPQEEPPRAEAPQEEPSQKESPQAAQLRMRYCVALSDPEAKSGQMPTNHVRSSEVRRNPFSAGHNDLANHTYER